MMSFAKALFLQEACCFSIFLLRCPNVPGRLRIGNDLYLHFAVPAEGVEKQAVWYMKDLVLACFDTVKPKALRIRAAEVRKAAAETHARIWPQWSVPETEFLREPGSEEKRGVLKAAWLPTSMMLSAVVCLLSNTKRAPKYREMAFKILREIVEQVCSVADEHAKLDVMHVSIHGAVSWRRCSLQSPRQASWCNKAFRVLHVQGAWIFDLNSDAAPWVTSSCEMPHLADWIAFCLDQPVKHQNQSLMKQKKVLEPGVLTMISQLAFNLDGAATRVGDDLAEDAKVHKHLSRMTSFVMWGKTGVAANLLLQGKAFS